MTIKNNPTRFIFPPFFQSNPFHPQNSISNLQNNAGLSLMIHPHFYKLTSPIVHSSQRPFLTIDHSLLIHVTTLIAYIHLKNTNCKNKEIDSLNL